MPLITPKDREWAQTHARNILKRMKAGGWSDALIAVKLGEFCGTPPGRNTIARWEQERTIPNNIYGTALAAIYAQFLEALPKTVPNQE